MRDLLLFPVLEPPPGGRTRLLARVRAADTGRRARGLRLALLPVSFAALALALFLVTSGDRRPPPLAFAGDPAAALLGIDQFQPTLQATPGRVAWLAPAPPADAR